MHTYLPERFLFKSSDWPSCIRQRHNGKQRTFECYLGTWRSLRRLHSCRDAMSLNFRCSVLSFAVCTNARDPELFHLAPSCLRSLLTPHLPPPTTLSVFTFKSFVFDTGRPHSAYDLAYRPLRYPIFTRSLEATPQDSGRLP